MFLFIQNWDWTEEHDLEMVASCRHKKLSFALIDQTLADPPLTTQYACVSLSQENGQDF